MSAIKVSSETHSLERKSDVEQLDPVLEVNETVASEVFDKPREEGEWEEIEPKIFNKLDIIEPLTIESLNNAIYELGVINLCWPEINEPVFETRTCFPKSYYTNSNKERLLLAYAENFRRQFQFHYNARKPLFLQAPNECGLQKMICSTIRPTKLCFAGTNTWQGLASLVSDYFDYEPLRKPMLHISTNTDEYTLKNYYYPINLSDDENASNSCISKNKKITAKRGCNNIDIFFEKPKKMKKSITSSCVAQASDGGVSFISSNDEDGATASYLMKIEIFDMKNLKEVSPIDYWKHADLRLKYYIKSNTDKHYQNIRDIIYNITKQIACKDGCKKYFIERDNKKQ